MKATELTAGLTESNGRIGGWPKVTCGLTACTPGSAPGPTLDNEYGRTLSFYLTAVADDRDGLTCGPLAELSVST